MVKSSLGLTTVVVMIKKKKRVRGLGNTQS